MRHFTGLRITWHLRLAVAAGAVLAAIGGLLATPAIGASPAASALSGATLTGVTAAGPGSASAGSSAVTAKATHSFGINQKEAQPKSILLINGDRLVVNGKSTQVALAGGGFSAALMRVRIAGREYAIPDVAVPFLGRGLDLSLFDVAALSRATVKGGTAEGGTIKGGAALPVRISYTGRTPRLPGVTITSAAGGVAAGYLTTAGATAFGAALARQYAADHGKASYGSDGLFAGGTLISAAGAASTPGSAGSGNTGHGSRAPAAPKFPLHTVTVRGLTTAGRPDTGDVVYVFNSDNNAVYGDPYEDPGLFYHGTARFALPAGHYWAFGFFIGTDKKGNPTSYRAVLLPRITVSGNATIAVRAASATSQLAFTAPHPTTLLASAAQLLVTDPHGHDTSFGFMQGPETPAWFTPTTRPLEAGKLSEYVNAWLRSPPAAQPQPDSAPDLYAAEFENTSGILGAQHFTLAAGALATVRAVYGSDVTATAGAVVSGFTIGELNAVGTIGFIASVPVPSRVNEYLLARPGILWQNAYYQSLAALGGGQSDVVRAFTAGSDQTQDWNVYPLHTPLNSNEPLAEPSLNTYFGTALSATRAGNAVTFNATPFTDDVTGHSGTGFAQGGVQNVGTITGNFEFDVNGTRTATGQVTPDTSFGPFIDQLAVPAKPSTVALTLRARRVGALFPLSNAVSDSWTWTSAATPAVVPPSGWFCADGSYQCVVQPLLTFGYQVAGITLGGSTPAGTQRVTLTVGHQALTESPAAITRVTAAFSLDNGATWTPVAVSGSGATRTLAFSAAAGRFVSLKVTAKDAAGGKLTETIGKAFATQTGVAGAHAAVAASLTALVTPVAPAAAGTGSAGSAGSTGSAGASGTRGSAAGYRAACAAPGPGQARCFVLFAPEPAGARAAGSVGATGAAAKAPPAGWGPRQLEAAYRLPVSRRSHATVAVVEAYDTPGLETYLNDYRREYGLGSCTTANGCFRKVGQTGSARRLPANGVLSGWDLEATLDVDMVSAACPSCRILVVEANGQDFSQFASAENTAVRLGAAVVSNSYGAREDGQELPFAKAYEHPGRVIVASTGDYGYTAASFPAILPNVTAVGGTELSTAKDKRGWRETAWNSPGIGASSSGCSAYVAKPAWQHDKNCPGRTIADVSAVALNLAVYNKDWGGWGLVGGTSAAAPLIAGVYGLAGNAATVKPGYEYSHTKALFDVVSGTNDWFYGAEEGASCGNDYLCVAKPGYDAPTGLGSPDGTGAF